jgi:hypothetical protein
MPRSNSESPVVLPATLEGWTPVEADRTYSRETLFEYIDGGAELFLSYGFESLTTRNYTNPGQPDIIVDVFNMASSCDAFGVFMHTCEVIDETFGQGSQYLEGLLLFWKDDHYVSIFASPETPPSKEAIFTLARHIEAAIPTEGPLPEIVSLLPNESLVPESIRYFHHHVWLNSHYFVADENIFQIDDTTDAVLAKYGRPPEQRVLLLIRYPNEDHARRGQADFLKYYLPDHGGKPATQIEDGTWAGGGLEGTLLTVVFGAPSQRAVTDMLTAVHRRTKE